jgi:hypothetical protein
MGEHVPDFIAKSFDERRGGPPRPYVPEADDSIADEGEADHRAAEIIATSIDEPSVAAVSDAPVAAVTEDTAEAPKPKRRRRVKKAEADAPASNDAD